MVRGRGCRHRRPAARRLAAVDPDGHRAGSPAGASAMARFRGFWSAGAARAVLGALAGSRLLRPRRVGSALRPPGHPSRRDCAQCRALPGPAACPLRNRHRRGALARSLRRPRAQPRDLPGRDADVAPRSADHGDASAPMDTDRGVAPASRRQRARRMAGRRRSFWLKRHRAVSRGHRSSAGRLFRRTALRQHFGRLAIASACVTRRGALADNYSSYRDSTRSPLRPPELRLNLPEIEGGGHALARPPPQPGELRYIAGTASWMIRPNFAGSLSESSRGTKKYSAPAGSSVTRSRTSSPRTVRPCGTFFGSAA
jgi:hypothetical protein